MTTTPQNTHRPRTASERSAAQIAASRANGAKSRGPKTPEGKEISAMNALRHGCLAKLTVMKGEDERGFMQLSANLIHAFHPTDEHECNLVETMLICMWRRNRALAMETAGMSLVVLKQAGITPPTPDPLNPHDTFSVAFKGFITNPAESHALELLHRYEARHTRAYERAAKSLDAYRKERQTNPSPYDLPDPEPDPAPDAPTTQPQIQPNEPEPPTQPDSPVVGQPFLAAAAFPGSRDRTSDSASPSTPAPTQPQNQPNEPEHHPRQPLNRRERRQLKWQKAHPKHVPTAPNPRSQPR